MLFYSILVYLFIFRANYSLNLRLTFIYFLMKALIRNEFDDNSDLPLGSDYIQIIGFDSYTKEECASALVIFLIFYAIIFLVFLKYLNFEAR